MEQVSSFPESLFLIHKHLHISFQLTFTVAWEMGTSVFLELRKRRNREAGYPPGVTQLVKGRAGIQVSSGCRAGSFLRPLDNTLPTALRHKLELTVGEPSPPPVCLCFCPFMEYPCGMGHGSG
jgi:hypothetical protein